MPRRLPPCRPLALGLAASLTAACGADTAAQEHTDAVAPSDLVRAGLPSFAGKTFRLHQPESDKFLDVAGGSRDNAAMVVNADRSGRDSQAWTLVAAKGVEGAYQVVNKASGRCLDIPGSSQQPGMVVQQYDCNTSRSQKNQLWWLNQQGEMTFFLVGVNAGLQLEVKDHSRANGAQIVQSWTQTGHLQKWKLEEVSGPSAAAPAAPTSAPATKASSPPAQAGTTAGADVKAEIKDVIKKLMNVPRQVPGYNETRGGPGNFEQLPAAVLDEYVASILDCAERFLPKSLPLSAKVALLAADISAESAFRVGTAGMNPNPQYGMSVGVQQVTPSIWVPMFKERANLPGLTHYDGSPWNPADTTMESPSTSIWDNMHIANWAISEQAKSHAGNPGAQARGEDVGTCPATWWTGLYCWVSGYPACRCNGDQAQSQHYRAMQTADLKVLGLDPALLDSAF